MIGSTILSILSPLWGYFFFQCFSSASILQSSALVKGFVEEGRHQAGIGLVLFYWAGVLEAHKKGGLFK